MTKNIIPLVSVVMNNYNNGKYLDEAINSIINQDYKNIELIIVDAFSTDNSREIIDTYASKHKSIKKIYVDKFEPFPSITYNLGFIDSVGEYIAIADSDDISLPNRLKEQVNFLAENKNIEVVGSDCYEFYKSPENKTKIKTSLDKNIKHAAPPVRNPSIMFRKSILSKYGLWDWRSEFAADYEWLYRMYIQGASFHLISEPLILYRKSLSNISHSKAILQSLKLLKFKIYFGILTLNIFKFNWFKSIISSILYLIILFFRKLKSST